MSDPTAAPEDHAGDPDGVDPDLVTDDEQARRDEDEEVEALTDFREVEDPEVVP